MTAFNELYRVLLKAAVEGKTQQEVEEEYPDSMDAYQLDCLLHPEKHAPILNFGDCTCCEEESSCISGCIFNAIRKNEEGKIFIDSSLCAGCMACVEACAGGKLTASRDTLPVLYAVRNAKGPVYALIAPAFIGQFDRDITPGMLRSAFKKLGFAGMVEVALFADILTLKEALEFDKRVLKQEDFLLTSCCCPVWLAMIRKVYRQYINNIPGSVSPMIAGGRAIKLLEPDAVTVFIGPCVAKKAEARERDISGAIDFVLTFEEIRDIFDAFKINLREMEDDARDHSSVTGRIYAYAGGVSRAVADTVKRLNPRRKISVEAQTADGVPACREMLNRLKKGNLRANFLEGMGCRGGCVGGPKAVLSREKGRENAVEYGRQAAHFSPVDNPYVLEMLKHLGFDSVESLLDESGIFTRFF